MRHLFALCYAASTVAVLPATVTFTQNTLIDENNLAYDNLDVVVSNCTVTIDGYHAFRSLSIDDYGVVTHSPASHGEPTHRLDLAIAQDLKLNGGNINVSSCGYGPGLGPGGGWSSTNVCGGSYGGYGRPFPFKAVDPFTNQKRRSGPVYGSITAPVDFGSGGGIVTGTSGVSASGGGAVNLRVGGTLVLGGHIRANGENSGSGGSILIVTKQLAGWGNLEAVGGSPGGGGGGRIAVYYDSYSATNPFTGSMNASGTWPAGPGTILLKKTGDAHGVVKIEHHDWVVGTPTIPNADGAATRLDSTLWPTNFPCDLVATGGAVIYVESPITVRNLNLSWAILTVDGPVGKMAITTTGDAYLSGNSEIFLDGKGYGSGGGPGAGAPATEYYGSGGGHGGVGGKARDGLAGGIAYDSATAPVECGSGGGRGDPSVGDYNILGRAGGGALRLEVAGTLKLLGSLTASAINVSGEYAYGGGGAGGSIWVTAGKMTGTGYLYAFGGSPGGGFYNGGGGGAGGRIAVYAREYAFGGFIPTPGGSGSGSDSNCWGGDGTAVLPANHPIPFTVIAGEPLGPPTGPVYVIRVTFNSLFNYDSISQRDFLIQTPSGTVPVNQTYLQLSTASAELRCPALTEPGEYQVQVGPHITNLYGMEMVAPITIHFTLRRPIISGVVANNRGYPIPGITVRTDDGSSSSVTDAHGVYGLNTPAGNFTFKPIIPGAVMLPPSVSITSLSQDITNQNFTVYAELPPRITLNRSTSLWRAEWWSTTGFTYQPQTSSNLVDWTDYGQPQPGTGGLLYINLPALTDPSRRFTRIKVPLN